MEKTIEIQEHGLMLTDYFNGTNGVMLNIHVDNKTTKQQILEQLKEEINYLCDHIDYVAEYHNCNSKVVDRKIKQELKRIERYIKKEKNKIVFPDIHNFEELENEDYQDEQPVLIFTIEFINK